jgi:hypothetical protein
MTKAAWFIGRTMIRKGAIYQVGSDIEVGTFNEPEAVLPLGVPATIRPPLAMSEVARRSPPQATRVGAELRSNSATAGMAGRGWTNRHGEYKLIL